MRNYRLRTWFAAAHESGSGSSLKILTGVDPKAGAKRIFNPMHVYEYAT